MVGWRNGPDDRLGHYDRSLLALMPQKSSLRISAVLRASAVMTAVKPINAEPAEGSQRYAESTLDTASTFYHLRCG
jgi:hypothetical protein